MLVSKMALHKDSFVACYINIRSNQIVKQDVRHDGKKFFNLVSVFTWFYHSLSLKLIYELYRV